MKMIDDDQFKRLNQAVTLHESTKQKMYQNIIHPKKKTSYHILPKIITVLMALLFVGSLYYFLMEGSHKTVTDSMTTATLPKIKPPKNAFLVEWGSDDMDRGNHDMDTNYHSKLVVTAELQPINRGDILYYQYENKNRLGRVIGLPGETVAIRAGQVYIDGKKLDTFYGAATVRGKREEEYFKSLKDMKNWVNIPGMQEYFKTSMDPVTVEAGTVFMLIDHWWRGYDSRDLGPIPLNALQGKVLGYEK